MNLPENTLLQSEALQLSLLGRSVCELLAIINAFPETLAKGLDHWR
jgi:hypothetical protein